MGFLSNKIWVRIFLSHPKIDVKLQSFCGSGFSMFAVRVLAKPYFPVWSELTNNPLRKQRWGIFLYPQI